MVNIAKVLALTESSMNTDNDTYDYYDDPVMIVDEAYEDYNGFCRESAYLLSECAQCGNYSRMNMLSEGVIGGIVEGIKKVIHAIAQFFKKLGAKIAHFVRWIKQQIYDSRYNKALKTLEEIEKDPERLRQLKITCYDWGPTNEIFTIAVDISNTVKNAVEPLDYLIKEMKSGKELKDISFGDRKIMLSASDESLVKYIFHNKITKSSEIGQYLFSLFVNGPRQECVGTEAAQHIKKMISLCTDIQKWIPLTVFMRMSDACAHQLEDVSKYIDYDNDALKDHRQLAEYLNTIKCCTKIVNAATEAYINISKSISGDLSGINKALGMFGRVGNAVYDSGGRMTVDSLRRSRRDAYIDYSRTDKDGKSHTIERY